MEASGMPKEWSPEVVLSSARPLFGQVVPSFLNGLWFWVRFLLSVTVSYLMFFPPHWRVKLPSSKLCTKQDHRGIEKTVEDTCCHVSLIPLPTLESRDEIPVRGVEL